MHDSQINSISQEVWSYFSRDYWLKEMNVGMHDGIFKKENLYVLTRRFARELITLGFEMKSTIE